jgi:hypothetical protein
MKTVPPINPATIQSNLLLMRKVFKEWIEKYLPDYEAVVTSEYRDKNKNASVGGSKDSAHLYALATDFVLNFNGVRLTEEQLKRVYEEKIKPNWPDFSLFEGDHVHINLPRNFSQATKYIGWAISTAIAGFFIKKVWTNRK